MENTLFATRNAIGNLPKGAKAVLIGWIILSGLLMPVILALQVQEGQRVREAIKIAASLEGTRAHPTALEIVASFTNVGWPLYALLTLAVLLSVCGCMALLGILESKPSESTKLAARSS